MKSILHTSAPSCSGTFVMQKVFSTFVSCEQKCISSSSPTLTSACSVSKRPYVKNRSISSHLLSPSLSSSQSLPSTPVLSSVSNISLTDNMVLSSPSKPNTSRRSSLSTSSLLSHCGEPRPSPPSTPTLSSTPCSAAIATNQVLNEKSMKKVELHLFKAQQLLELNQYRESFELFTKNLNSKSNISSYSKYLNGAIKAGLGYIQHIQQDVSFRVDSFNQQEMLAILSTPETFDQLSQHSTNLLAFINKYSKSISYKSDSVSEFLTTQRKLVKLFTDMVSSLASTKQQSLKQQCQQLFGEIQQPFRNIENHYQQLSQNALDSMNNHHYELAIEQWNQLENENIYLDNEKLILNRANCYFSLGQYQSCVSDVEALLLSRKRAHLFDVKIEIQSYILLSECYEKLQNYEQSEYYCEKILKYYPKNITVLNKIATNNFSLQRLEKSKEYFERVLDLDSNHYCALFCLGKIQAFSKQYQDAYPLFNRSLESLEMGDYHSSTQEYNEYKSDVMGQLGHCFLNLYPNNLDLSKGYLEESLKYEQNVFACSKLSKIYLLSNDLEKAISYLDLAFKIDKNDSHSHQTLLELGLYLMDAKKYLEAFNALKNTNQMVFKEDTNNQHLNPSMTSLFYITAEAGIFHLVDLFSNNLERVLVQNSTLSLSSSDLSLLNEPSAQQDLNTMVNKLGLLLKLISSCDTVEQDHEVTFDIFQFNQSMVKTIVDVVQYLLVTCQSYVANHSAQPPHEVKANLSEFVDRVSWIILSLTRNNNN
ncbi:hypothetical protein CYY_006220 [Polysphondylium violaceum]|uniref:Tetratricopeptide-like helical domain-containing protein n=1 Tax=Polysphondylium violaceum TaxID=133409 RepID=A0A8J4UYB5_9MYCE|nr:hypothetical protein CYY_006220 [Polysphondylium violaceum]